MVEYVSIGSLLTRKRDKAKKIGGEAPVYAVTNDKGFVLSSDLHDFTIHSEDTANYMVVEKNDFAYNPSRLNIGSIAYFKNDGKGLISPMYVVFHADEKRVLPEYLFIAIKSEAIRNKIDSLKEEGARFRFDFKRWDLIQIPIPSLSEQTHIVGILDTFTTAIENLKQQIIERRKQYEYYRDELLDLEGKEGVEMKTLGEVCSIKTGKGITQEVCSDEYPYPVISGGKTPMGCFWDFNRNENTVTVSRVGAYAGFVSFITEKFYLNDKCFSVIPNGSFVEPKFLYNHLKNKEVSIKQLQSEGGVPTINTQKLNTLTIPIPSIREQSRIVSILDTFEASIANLEAQLKEREKQYEYYRNKLLTFE